MDILSYQKGMKAKKALKTLHKRLGATNEYKAGATDIESTYLDTDERLDTLEKNNPGDVLLNRVSAIEANTHINLNKHNLQVESMLTAESFKHQNMVFDDLSDATGIDAGKSIDILHDKVVGKVGIAVGKDAAEIVTVAEELAESPTMVALSFTGNSNLKNTVPLDLTKGVHTNTEVIGEKIQLQASKTVYSYGSDVVPSMTGVASPSPYQISNSSYRAVGQEGYFAFKDTSSIYEGWVANAKTGWLEVTLGQARIIKKYTLKMSTGLIPLTGAPKDWTFEGWSGLAWVILDIQSNITDWGNMAAKEFSFNNSLSYSKYRINISANNGHATHVVIHKMEIMEEISVDSYYSSGFYESSIIDLGENFKSLYKLDSTMTAPVGTTIIVSVASSNNGVSFTAYTPINTDGTIATAPGRYVKVKIELKASGAAKETVVHDFVEVERSNFQENEYVVFDGSAKLKVNYSDAMEVDSGFADGGTLLKSMINKSSFKNIEKVEVSE